MTAAKRQEFLRKKYDTAKFTDREIEDELNNRPPRHRSEAYLAALRAEAASRLTHALGGLNPDEGDREGNQRDAGGRASPAASGQGLPDDMDELDVWLAEHADLAVVSEVEQLRAENARLSVNECPTCGGTG